MAEHIEDLIDLAREKSALSRRRLFENMADLFLSEDGRLTEHERALMTDILTKLIQSMELELRKELSAFLIQSEANLPEVVRLLSNDEIDVARPLLEKSKLLQDSDLIEIVRMRTDEHRLSIALREDLDAEVSDVLIQYGDGDVIEALLRNTDARLSDRAMAYLVSESRRTDRFQEPLLNRADLPLELACRMYWWVAAALRQRILLEFEISPADLDHAIRKSTHAVIAGGKETSGAYSNAQRLVRRLQETDDLTVEFLLAALRQNRVAVFVAGLAELGETDFRTAWRIFTDPGGEGLAVIARAAGLTREQFTALYLLVAQVRGGSGPQSTSILARISELFDSLPEKKSRVVLQYWQCDDTYEIALESLQKVG